MARGSLKIHTYLPHASVAIRIHIEEIQDRIRAGSGHVPDDSSVFWVLSQRNYSRGKSMVSLRMGGLGGCAVLYGDEFSPERTAEMPAVHGASASEPPVLETPQCDEIILEPQVEGRALNHFQE